MIARALRLVRIAAGPAIAAAGLFASVASAQNVGINDTGAAADTSAILDASSTSKGLLVPRMTAAQRAAIVSPATGLVVFQSDGASGLYYNAGSSASPNWQMVGANAATADWSTSGSNLYYMAGNVAVGTTPGSYRFAVQDTGLVFRVQANNANSAMASFGGYGRIQVDAPGTAAGRLSMLDNGYLGLGRTTPAARLDVLGGNGDAINGEGDARIGDNTYRVKVGVTTSGAGAGGVMLMQRGLLNGYNVLALGAQGNKVAYMNGGTARFGIGTDSPNAPLGFTATSGKKIALYPGANGDYGAGIGNYRLQLTTENLPYNQTSIAMGADSSGTFLERFAFKSNGALAVMGSVGTAGQVLQSSGAGAAAAWSSASNGYYNNTTAVWPIGVQDSLVAGAPEVVLSGMTRTFAVTGNTRVLVSFSVAGYHFSDLGSKEQNLIVALYLDGVRQNAWPRHFGSADSYRTTVASTMMLEAGPGSHTVDIRASLTGAGYMNIGYKWSSHVYSYLTLQEFTR